MSLSSSRGPEIDTNLCVENIGNRFDLVLVAAVRSREITRKHRYSEKMEHVKAPVTALLEIQDGKISREYLKRVR